MLPVVSLNGIKIGNGNRGNIFNRLLKYWSEKVQLDIEKQIINWDKNKKIVNSLTPYKFK